MRLKFYPQNNAPHMLERVTEILEEGGVIIYPTDTAYALGCHALKERAIERICRIKGVSPARRRFAIVCDSLSSVSNYAKLTDEAFRLMKKNLPGPFTFVLETTSGLPKIFRQRKEVGIRMPDCGIVQEMVRHLEAPILTTTLPEVEGEQLTNPELIEEVFGSRVDAVIDGGEGGTQLSAVVRVVGKEVELLREGPRPLLV